MGMTNDNADRVTIEEKPVVAAKVEEPKKPIYTIIGAITLNKKDCLLLTGEDHRWYKAYPVRTFRYDEKNRSPLMTEYGPAEPFTEEDMNYFK